VLQPGVDRLAFGLGARQGRSLAGEGGHAALQVTLGEQQRAHQRQDQNQAPHEQRPDRRWRSCPSSHHAARDDRVVDNVLERLEVQATWTSADQRDEQAGHRQHHCAR
jgi:hypothetical protein